MEPAASALLALEAFRIRFRRTLADKYDSRAIGLRQPRIPIVLPHAVFYGTDDAPFLRLGLGHWVTLVGGISRSHGIGLSHFIGDALLRRATKKRQKKKCWNERVSHIPDMGARRRNAIGCPVFSQGTTRSRAADQCEAGKQNERKR